MAIKDGQLNELREILLKEYGTTLSEEELLSEALRLSVFAKTVFSFKLSQTDQHLSDKEKI